MIEEVQSERTNDTEAASNVALRAPLLQRKCACGGSAGLSGPCDECSRKRLMVQNYSTERHTFESSLAGLAQPLFANTFGPPRLTTGATVIQRQPADENSSSTGSASSTENSTSEANQAGPTGLIAEDDATEVAPHQMRKSDFLAQLSAELASAAEPILATRGRTADNCPYLTNWIAYGYTRSGSYVETFVRRFANVNESVASAAQYIPLVRDRMREALLVWADTGQITGVPADVHDEVAGTNQMAAVERLGARIGSEEGAETPSATVQAKAVEGVNASNPDPHAVQSSLSGGAALEGKTRQRMESAIGYSFSRVRVHHDNNASSLANKLSARAFTVGHHIAFAAGEYKPGTLIGDALLAHELAHVVQQGATTSSDVASKSLSNAASTSLETDADRSAVGAVVKLWSHGKSAVAGLAQNSFPRLRSGLRLSRCSSCRSSSREDAGTGDAGRQDAGPPDAQPDAGRPDAGPPPSNCNLNPTADDQAVLDRINSSTFSSSLVQFLTGRLDPTSTAFTDIHSRIQGRVNAKVSDLNNIKPSNLPNIRVVSEYRGFRENPPGTSGRPQAQIVFDKFFMVGSAASGWDSFPSAFKTRGRADRTRWLAAPTLTRLQGILRFSAVPGASRHHWMTDVDFNSTTSSDWEGSGTFAPLGAWLSPNACRQGFVQAYPPGRSGGHNVEQWHYSYAPISVGIKQLYTSQILDTPQHLQTAVLDPIVAEFTSRASAAGVTLPSDFQTGLQQLNIAEYVNTIDPRL